MRITCPYCGTRDVGEFTYLGDATKRRPMGLNTSIEEMADYVYVRDNPAGKLREFWYHGAGCHAWLIVSRNVTTHDVLTVESAHEASLTEGMQS